MSSAKCNVTERSIPIEDGFIVFDHESNRWLFCSSEELDKLDRCYRVDATHQMQGQEDFIDAMAHLYRKPWFDPQAFFEFINKLKVDNKIRGG